MQAVIVRHLFALIFSFLLGIYLVPIIIRAAKKIGFMDAPDGRLKHQKQPVAYLGGVAVFLPFITTLGLCYPFENIMMWLLLGTTLLLFIGLIDDLKVLKPSQKFFGQFLAVLAFLKGGFSLQTPFFSSLTNIFWSGFWMLTVINAFNLVDVMDGLCATLAGLSALIFGIIAYMQGNYNVSILLAAFLGSISAFFWFNKPQAKIYLGDAGSLLVGGFMSSVPFMFWWEPGLFETSRIGQTAFFYQEWIEPLCQVFFIPCLVLAVPLLEGLGLFFIRTKMGLPFYNGSPHHFSIYLQKRSWSRWQVLGFVTLTSVLCATVAVLFLNHIISFSAALAAAILLIAGWVWMIFY